MELILPAALLCILLLIASRKPNVLHKRCLAAFEEVRHTADESLARWSLPRLMTAQDKIGMLQKKRYDDETRIRHQLQLERVSAALEQHREAIRRDERARADDDYGL